MVTERKEGAPGHDEHAVHPELMRARTFAASLKQEWQALFEEPLALTTRSFTTLHTEEAHLAARLKENEERLRLTMAQRETAHGEVASAQDELATGQSLEHIKARVRYTLSAPHVEQRILGRILRRVIGTGPKPSTSRLDQARTETAHAAQQLAEAERLHAVRLEELQERQAQLTRRPTTIVHQLNDRMELIAAVEEELAKKYVSAFPENGRRAVHTFAEVHLDDPAIIQRYFPDFCLEARHQKEAAKRVHARSLYQRLERKQPGEPIGIADLTRTELTYWIDYISYRFLKECLQEESSRLRQVIPELTMPRLV